MSDKIVDARSSGDQQAFLRAVARHGDRRSLGETDFCQPDPPTEHLTDPFDDSLGRRCIFHPAIRHHIGCCPLNPSGIATTALA